MQIAAVAAASCVLYLVWRLVRDFVVRSPLDKIPGPPPASIVWGTWDVGCHGSTQRLTRVGIGNMFQIFNHNSWKFLDNLIETYGPLAKFQGFFGVRSYLF